MRAVSCARCRIATTSASVVSTRGGAGGRGLRSLLISVQGGFPAHEEEDASAKVVSLGRVIDGEQWIAYNRPERAERPA
eukprot:1598685-Pyramimonas_sp.AAC.1